MASNGWPFNYRIPSLDMFSFSLNPEITSFLWMTTSPRVESDTGLQYHVAQPTRQLFDIVVPLTNDETSFLSVLHYAVVTSGILVIVGVGSVCSFKLLQCVRQSGCSSMLQKVRRYVFKPSSIFNWKKSETSSDNFSSNNNFNVEASSNSNLSKRPSDLRIVSSPIGHRLLQKSRESSLERRLLIKDRTPLADCEVASGEEDINDIQGQYFGPTVDSSTICMELTGSSPEDTPTHYAIRRVQHC